MTETPEDRGAIDADDRAPITSDEPNEPGSRLSEPAELIDPATGSRPHTADGPVDEGDAGSMQAVTEPAKVMRIGSMVKQLLEEVRMTTLDEASRERLAEVYERSITELGSSLSDDLRTELHHLALPFRDDGPPSEAELRVAKAQLVGWLEGLFHGIQATLFAQQLAARQQLEQMRQLPQGPQQGVPPQRPGTYL